jgi:hypothetical protein
VRSSWQQPRNNDESRACSSGGGSGWAALWILADRIEERQRRGVVRSRYSCLSTLRPSLCLAKIFAADFVGIGEYLRRDPALTV